MSKSERYETTRVLPLDVSCDLHAKEIRDARVWIENKLPAKPKEVLDAYEFGFDDGWLRCLTTLERTGYLKRFAGRKTP
jgi:hypothetical protein